MLLNLASEHLAALRRKTRMLAHRARLPRARPPVLLVPSILGTRLSVPSGRLVWGGVRHLYGRCDVARAPEVAVAGVLRGFAVVPGVWEYDVFGRLLRFLDRVGGYRAGEDLHVVTHDWRMGLEDTAGQIARAVDRVRGASDEKVDLVAISTGGLSVRRYLGTAPATVRRAIYVGTPQDGSLDALEYLTNGVRVAPLGRRFPAGDVARLQTVWDALPARSPFVDESGDPVSQDLFDPATWARIGLPAPADLAARLEGARAFRAALEAGVPHEDAFVIGGTHVPTSVRCVIGPAGPRFPPCDARSGWAFAYEPGDGTVPLSSLTALPGLPAGHVWPVRPRQHREMPADPAVHHLVVEALLASARTFPLVSLGSRAERRRELGEVPVGERVRSFDAEAGRR